MNHHEGKLAKKVTNTIVFECLYMKAIKAIMTEWYIGYENITSIGFDKQILLRFILILLHGSL